MILAGIVSYNPDLERLRENLDAVRDQADQVVLFDNASDNAGQLCKLIADQYHEVHVIRCEENKGIAYGLAKIMEYAREVGADWVLTLDQDSVCYPGLTEQYRKYWDDEQVGALTCNYFDRNLNTKSLHQDLECYETDVCITAGMLMRTDAYFATAGYDIKMFIDWVDFDICCALRKKGYKILHINYMGFLHEVGKNSRVIKMFGKSYCIYNQSKIRHYYAARNNIYLSRKYPDIYPMRVHLPFQIYSLLLVFYEENSFSKLLARCRGVIDGLRMEMQDSGTAK